MLSLWSLYADRIDNPIEDSVAERVNINKTKIWPVISSRYKENVMKLKFTANKSNSRDIIIFNTFPRFNTNPNIPIWKRVADTAIK